MQWGVLKKFHKNKSLLEVRRILQD